MYLCDITDTRPFTITALISCHITYRWVDRPASVCGKLSLLSSEQRHTSSTINNSNNNSFKLGLTCNLLERMYQLKLIIKSNRISFANHKTEFN